MARVTYKDYKNRFDKLIKSKGKVYDRRVKRYIPIPYEEKWVQCYDKDDPVRSEYPKYIFVSDEGNLVSTENKNKPILLKPSFTSNNRESYGFSVKTGYKNKKGQKSRKKSQISYIWVAVCFGSETFGKADEIMKAEGLKAFSSRKLNIHHIEGYDLDKGRAYNNNPETLEILTVNIHKLFDKIPDQGSSEEEEINFMLEMSKRVSEETDKPTILIPIYDDKATTGYIQNIPEDSKIISQIQEKYTELLLENFMTDSIQKIIEKKDAEYFDTERYVAVYMNPVKWFILKNNKNRDGVEMRPIIDTDKFMKYHNMDALRADISFFVR